VPVNPFSGNKTIPTPDALVPTVPGAKKIAGALTHRTVPEGALLGTALGITAVKSLEAIKKRQTDVSQMPSRPTTLAARALNNALRTV